MKNINSNLIYSIIKSNILFSKNKNIKVLNYTQVVNEIKQLLFLLKYSFKNKINVYIVCDIDQQKFLFHKFLLNKEISVITTQTAIKIKTPSFFILMENNKNTLINLIKSNHLIFLINSSQLKLNLYKLTINMDTFHKVLFLISLIKNYAFI